MINEENVNQAIFDYEVGKMVFDDRQFKVVFIPVEIRDGLKSVLRDYKDIKRKNNKHIEVSTDELN